MKTLIGVIVLAASVAAASDPPNVTGTWTMGLEAGHVVPVALVLKQDGKKLTGTITLPTQNNGQRIDVPLTGEFADGAFSLSGTVDDAADPRAMEIVGKVNDDGSLEGTVKSHHGTMHWTAERLKERKK
jgi:hypothetical protein